MTQFPLQRRCQFHKTLMIIVILMLVYISVKQIRVIVFADTSFQHGFMSLVDEGASPVFSADSKLNGNHVWGVGHSGVIEMSYEPIDITDDMTQVAIEDTFIKLTLQRQILCLDWKMYGLKTDGGWPVCRAKVLQPTKPCTVYSFGMGATKQHEHSPGIHFYPIGLYDQKQYDAFQGWHLDSYMGLLKQFGEENMTIPYLKFDIETMEWEVLENILSDGSLNNVMQLSFEIHVHSLPHVKYFFQLIKKLEMAGFRRWFYHHRLNGNAYQCDQSFINIRYLKPH